MAKKVYKIINFRPATLLLIDKCNFILDKYNEAGYDMTLRQLYYQLVSADEIPNKQTEYDRLGSIVNDARLGGLIDWDYIVDRTRNIRSLAHWDEPSDIIAATAKQFRIDKWATQKHRIEVWIEKDALAGVFERVCNSLDIPLFSCRGYTSQSEMWAAGQRLKSWDSNDQEPLILHFGDHDPSGIDMTRDIIERLEMFCGFSLHVERLALNMPQIELYDPPPNPAKLTDSRAIEYVKKYGYESWELDALEPDVLADLVRQNVMSFMDTKAWESALKIEKEQRLTLEKISTNFAEVEQFVNNF